MTHSSPHKPVKELFSLFFWSPPSHQSDRLERLSFSTAKAFLFAEQSLVYRADMAVCLLRMGL